MTLAKTSRGLEPTKLPRNITIKDLAAELKLSITTISRALNGYSDVGEATRERVVEAAERLGYHPNRNAQRLVTRRTHVLAWIQSDNDRKFVDPHFVEVMAGVLRSARVGNYDVVLTGHASDRQIQVYNRLVSDNSVDGFILDLPEPDDPRISFLLESNRPFVVHGRDARADRYGWVDIDNAGIFGALVELLAANGHRNIAFINGDERFTFAINRRLGIEATLDRLGLPRATVRIFNTTHPMGNAGFQLTTAALEDGAVTAILYSSALMAVEGHAALLRAGRDPGRNIAIASMDDQLHYLDLSPFAGRITFARSSLSDAGEALVTELIRACENKGPPKGVMIPHSFVLAEGVDGSVLAATRG